MTYTELVAAAKAYADRQDIEVSDNIDVFILMVEARMNRILKTREQTARAYTLIIADQEYYGLPVDYRGMRNIQLTKNQPSTEHDIIPIDYETPEMFDRRTANTSHSNDAFYTILADQIQLHPVIADYYIEMAYYQKVPNLNDTDTTNWISNSHPDMYLSGLVAEIEAFAKNYDVAKTWYDRLTSAMSELDTSDEKERWSGVSMSMRLA